LVAALWHFGRAWQFSGALGVRWLVCAAIIGGAYVVLGRGMTARQFPKRIYRYAE
jgi:hypothetical protein